MATLNKDKYIEAVGRRKTAVARIRISPASKTTFKVNEKSLEEYLPVEKLQETVRQAFSEAGISDKYAVSAMVKGGGISAQAEAIRLGISRALIKQDSTLRTTLKKAGFLKRDPRVKERKKFGKKKARKSPQWSKR